MCVCVYLLKLAYIVTIVYNRGMPCWSAGGDPASFYNNVEAHTSGVLCIFL